MSNDPWDGLPNGNYAKWENVGDTVVGDIISKGLGDDMNGNKVPQLIVRVDDGSEITVTAGQAQLKAKLLEQKPNVGDRIQIKFTSSERRDGGKTLKHFEVNVKTGGAKTPPPQQAALAAAEDF